VCFEVRVFWTVLCCVAKLLTTKTFCVVKIFFFEAINVVFFFRLNLMFLDSTPWGICNFLTTTPPLFAVKFRLMRFTAPIKIILFKKLRTTNFAYFESSFNFPSIFFILINSLFKLFFLKQKLIFSISQTFTCKTLILNYLLLLQNKIVSFILKYS